jgi:hypothetical protein
MATAAQKSAPSWLPAARHVLDCSAARSNAAAPSSAIIVTASYSAGVMRWAGGRRRDRRGWTFSHRRIGRTSPLAIIDGARLSPGVVPHAGSNADWLRGGRAHGHGSSWFSSRFLRRPARRRTGHAADDGAERSSDDRSRNGSGHRTGGRSFLSLRGRGQQHHRQRDQCKTGSHRGLTFDGSRSPLSLGGKHGGVKADRVWTRAAHPAAGTSSRAVPRPVLAHR